MPQANAAGTMTPFMDALFTATSAITVTGLTVEVTATYWSGFGKVIILLLMFIGGLGIMTTGAFLLVLIGRRVSIFQRQLVKESISIMPVNEVGGIVKLVVRIVLISVLVQIIGFVIYLIRLLADMDAQNAIPHAIFLSVSAFNNAGFTAFVGGDSISMYQKDVTIVVASTILIFIGAVSVWVVADILAFRNKIKSYSLNTKLVLAGTLILTIFGSLVFFGFEYNNSSTIQDLSLPHKIMISIFESVSGRTAGFTTVAYSNTEQHTNFLMTGLMFIGGASGSVAGGIKVNTFAVIVVAVFSTLQGRQRASIFNREISSLIVKRAMVIGAIGTSVVFIFSFLLTAVESEFDFIDLLFEIVSAFGTVGLSTGLTPDLSRWGHLILIFAMFIGRVGPLALGLAMTQRTQRENYRYTQERVTIG
ncbi:MAG: Trk family potassium uptake protein [Dehalococcoidia bacterium]|mgnify:CR=1 FL=1|nr:Trk family potassium uptake protein [Dehalococcoidia bacterium]MQG15684.1 Trk family potassium uptake protein [SAR202 cluster bacterium]|tara:strand:- start:11367 stop:12626 length:1260 start_codon:yes stop_codon:yes gene_type:complete